MSTPSPAKRNWSDLRPRIISGVILGAVCFSLVYSGAYGTALLTFVGSCVMIWEWTRMTLVGSVKAGWPERITGYLIIIAGCAGFLWLRLVPDYGLHLAFWLPLVVIGADVGAYFAGRAFGGPKLAPTISPNKTVSGALGGLAAATVIGATFAAVTGAGSIGIVAAVSLLTAAVSQGGDLLESAAKRRYGVKDASNILPGHGGVLDRFDALIAAVLLTVVLTLIAQSAVFAW